jgi:hypothetical protein
MEEAALEQKIQEQLGIGQREHWCGRNGGHDYVGRRDRREI